MLKIQSGAFRGRSLETIPSPLVRPILARIKKSLFDIIRPRISGANFLDLYAGTGAVGIEALSQGAAKVTFVEREARCVNVIHANLEKLKVKDRATVMRGDATGSLGRFMGSFDLIFMGPPYKDAEKVALALVEPTLNAIIKNDLCKPSGLIVAQHHKKEEFQVPDGWEMFRREPYGDTFLSFVRKKESAHS